EIDIKNPKANIHNAGFTPEEREKMDTLLHSGFIDTFRARYPDQKDAYTWWSYMRKARERNAGWRIDYFLVSKELGPQVKDSFIYSDVLGSDHCPIGLSL
ncbi:MAG TPA: exodeoxyribonuclease III, partial [Ruminococcaceae bacterium]|nr:exodeoxyribonuclease III [Oscillospiraceae bacterium]